MLLHRRIYQFFIIYLLLRFPFPSLWLPLEILVSIPLGFIGVIVSLKLFGSTTWQSLIKSKVLPSWE